MNYDNIPDELKILPQWSVYRTYPDKEKHEKLKKVIISPVDSSFAQSDNPKSWSDFKRAKEYAEKHGYKGVVFALTEGIIFFDLDHAIDKSSGEIILPGAKRLLELLPGTYAERSTSGTGMHILCKGSLPFDSYRRRDPIEIYDNRRFICMTGDIIDGRNKIFDYSDRLAEMAYKFVCRREPIKEYAVIPAVQSDTELIGQISNSKQGAKFDALYGGDICAYPSHSHADSGLIFILAWWTQDPAQIDRIFRSSGLMRGKWDSRRGSGTYGSQLISEALSRVSPRESFKRPLQREQYL
jgi:putative DNA primase/helicase